jgi:hypothetical protein
VEQRKSLTYWMRGAEELAQVVVGQTSSAESKAFHARYFSCLNSALSAVALTQNPLPSCVSQGISLLVQDVYRRPASESEAAIMTCRILATIETP